MTLAVRLLLLMLFLCPPLSAQSWELDLTDNVLLNEGGTAQISIDVLWNSQAWDGAQLALGVHPGELTVASIDMGLTLLLLNGGTGPFFFNANSYNECPDGRLYLQAGVIGAPLTPILVADGQLMVATVEPAPNVPLGVYTAVIKEVPELCINTVSQQGTQVSTIGVISGTDVNVDTVNSDLESDVSVIPNFFIRGDSNIDFFVDIADPVQMLESLFAISSHNCRDADDANDDGENNIADPIYVFQFLFASGPPPPDPFGPTSCTSDPTPDNLTCLNSSC